MHKLNLSDFDKILIFASDDFLFDASFVNLKIFFIRFYWFLKYIYIYNLYFNNFVFYFFCKLFIIPKPALELFYPVSAEYLNIKNLKMFACIEIIFRVSFIIKPTFFYFISYDIFRFRRFVLRVDNLTYMFLRYFLEWFRVFKYNEYVDNHAGLFLARRLRDFLRLPDPKYHYSNQIFIKYKKKFKKNLYLLLKFYFKKHAVLNDYINVDVSADFIYFGFFHLPYFRFFLLYYYNEYFMAWVIRFFLGYLKIYSLFFFYMTYVKSDAFFQNDDFYFFSETYYWRFHLYLAFDDNIVLFGPLYMHSKAITAKESLDNLFLYSFILSSNDSLFFDIMVRGFLYEIFALLMADYVTSYFMKRSIDLEFMSLIETINYITALINTKNISYIDITVSVPKLYLDFKFGLDCILWQVYHAAYIYAHNIPFFINFIQSLKQVYYQVFSRDLYVKFFLIVDYFASYLDNNFHDFVLRYLCYLVFRDFYFKLLERMCYLNFVFCFDLQSLFLFYLKIMNLRYFKYLNNNLFVCGFFRFQFIDTSFI